MMLLIVGFAVGLIAAFLLRILFQLEKDGMAKVADDVEQMVEIVARLESRVEALEAIVVNEDLGPVEAGRLRDSPDHRTGGGVDPSSSGRESSIVGSGR